MVSKEVLVRNKTGLHLRPATELSAVCSSCPCEVTLVCEKGRINPKSVLMLMGAGIKAGTTITVECAGDQEQESLDKIVKAIEGGFGEELVC